MHEIFSVYTVSKNSLYTNNVVSMYFTEQKAQLLITN